MSAGPLRKLFEILAVLRAENGCPWDRAQTIEDVLSSLIEEAYELQWAKARGSREELVDEMGDVVFVVCFAIALVKETDPTFTLENVVQHAYDKIKRRHPHVFGGESARTKEEGLAHWNRIKAEDKQRSGQAGGFFSGIPDNLPPMRRAERIQRIAAGTGFDWSDTRGIIQKIREELDELERSLDRASSAKIREEIGDLYFSVVNLSRFLDIDGELTLTHANAKFAARFEKMIELIESRGLDVAKLAIEQLDEFWGEAKRLL